MSSPCVVILLAAAVALLSPAVYMPTSAAADPTDGFTAIDLPESDIVIEKPYDVTVDQRYSFVKGVRSFWVFDDDEPFKPDSPTKPRTEIHFNGHDYSSGVWQFEGNSYVPSGTRGTTIMQIHRYTNGSSDLMLEVYDGELRYYTTTPAVARVYDRWVRLNVIHNADTREVTVFINGVQRLQVVSDKGPSTFNFKCGVYTQTNPSHRMESRWRGIKLYKKE